MLESFQNSKKVEFDFVSQFSFFFFNVRIDFQKSFSDINEVILLNHIVYYWERERKREKVLKSGCQDIEYKFGSVGNYEYDQVK